ERERRAALGFLLLMQWGGGSDAIAAETEGPHGSAGVGPSTASRSPSPQVGRKATDLLLAASVGPVQDHLARLARAHGFEALAIVLVGHLVGDQRLQIQAGLQ